MVTEGVEGQLVQARLARLRNLWAIGLRAPIRTAVAIAATARLLTAVVLRVSTRDHVVPDELLYDGMVDDVLSGRSNESQEWVSYYHGLWQRVRTFSEPHLLVTRIIGDTRFAGQLVSATFGVVAVAFTAMLATRVLGKRAGLIAGLIAALWPSQMLFSSLAIRDSTVWASTAIAVYCVYGFTRATERKAAAAWFAGFVFALFLLDGARDQTFAVVVFAAALTVLAAFRGSWITRLLIAGAVVVALPVVFGHGVANHSELNRFDSLASTRYFNAVDSRTPIVELPNDPLPVDEATTTAVSSTSSTDNTPDNTTDEATTTSSSSTSTNSDANNTTVDESAAGSIRHLPRGVVAVLFRPFPWDAGSDTGLRMARLESIPWFVLFVTALAGIWLCRTQWRDLLCPILVASGMVFVYALTEGNYGTAFRHKGEIVWIVAVFAAAAIDRLLDAITTKMAVSNQTDPQTPSR